MTDKDCPVTSINSKLWLNEKLLNFNMKYTSVEKSCLLNNKLNTDTQIYGITYYGLITDACT